MAQLIKLQDYITRYELDVYRYPSQYIRLKKQQWNAFQSRQNQRTEEMSPQHLEVEREKEESAKESKLATFLRPFKRKVEIEEVFPVPKVTSELDGWELPVIVGKKSPEEKKQLFLNAILPIQLKWASSTIRKMSYLQKNYKRDSLMTYFLQRFPDTFLVMYKPIFLVKQAPVELEIILITPTEIFAVLYLEEQEDSVVLGNNDRFWALREKENERKIVNPAISLNRMGSILKNVLSHHELELPVSKVLLHPKGYIDIFDGPTDIAVIDKRTYQKWFEKMRANNLPLKHNQLKAAGALLAHCQSTFVDRPEWK